MLAKLFGFGSLQKRLALIPVTAVLLASVVGGLGVIRVARNELYQSREQLAQGLANNIAQQLVDELKTIRDELSSWAAFLTSLDGAAPGGAGFVAAYQRWLRGLGAPTTSRYDALVVVDRAGKIVSVNDRALSVQRVNDLVVGNLVGMSASRLFGETNDQWLQPVIDRGATTGLPWRALPIVNGLYERREKPRTPDDVIRSHQIVIAVPLRSSADGAVVGALVAAVSWPPFQRIVDQGEVYMAGMGLKTGYGFVFDRDAERTIAHILRDPARQNLVGTGPTRNVNLSHVAQAAREATGRAFEYDFPAGNRKFAVFTAIDQPSGNSVFAFDWRLGIGVDYSDIYAPIDRLGDAVLVAALLIATAVGLVSWWLSNSLGLSVAEFTHIADEAAAGRFQLLERTTDDDEISKLGDAWNRLLVAMRQKNEVQSLANPYIVGTPVRSTSMFFGRQEDLRWIEERLSHPGNEFVLLYGERRIGKTSLLHQIRNGTRSKVIPILVDTHALVPHLLGDADFYSGLGRTMVRELSGRALSGVQRSGVHTAHDILDLVRSINAAFPNESVVFLFDEIEALDAKVKSGAVTSGISSFFAALLEGDCRVSLVTTGSSDNSRAGGPFWKTIGPKSLAKRIGLLGRVEGLRLIREPVEGYVDLADHVSEQILRLAGTHPYYTQTFCQLMIDTLNERHTRRVSLDVVQAVTDRLLREPPLPLDDMWTSSPVLRRWILAELSRLLPDAAAAVAADALLVNANAPANEVVAELRRLTNVEVLEETAAGYRFCVDLVRLWIRKEQLWWQANPNQKRQVFHG